MLCYASCYTCFLSEDKGCLPLFTSSAHFVYFYMLYRSHKAHKTSMTTNVVVSTIMTCTRGKRRQMDVWDSGSQPQHKLPQSIYIYVYSFGRDVHSVQHAFILYAKMHVGIFVILIRLVCDVSLCDIDDIITIIEKNYLRIYIIFKNSFISVFFIQYQITTSVASMCFIL